MLDFSARVCTDHSVKLILSGVAKGTGLAKWPPQANRNSEANLTVWASLHFLNRTHSWNLSLNLDPYGRHNNHYKDT